MKVTIELTDSEIEAILVTAGEGGSSYWALTVVPLRAAIRERVEIWDRDETYHPEDRQADWELTPAALRGAATRMAALVHEGRCAPSLLMQILEDPECADQPTADAFVQCAVFGNIRFG